MNAELIYTGVLGNFRRVGEAGDLSVVVSGSRYFFLFHILEEANIFFLVGKGNNVNKIGKKTKKETKEKIFKYFLLLFGFLRMKMKLNIK